MVTSTGCIRTSAVSMQMLRALLLAGRCLKTGMVWWGVGHADVESSIAGMQVFRDRDGMVGGVRLQQQGGPGASHPQAGPLLLPQPLRRGPHPGQGRQGQRALQIPLQIPLGFPLALLLQICVQVQIPCQPVQVCPERQPIHLQIPVPPQRQPVGIPSPLAPICQERQPQSIPKACQWGCRG